MIVHRGTLALMVIVSTLAPGPAMAAPSPVFDGNALAEACRDWSLYYTYGKCAGYIIGVHDQYVNDFGEPGLICLVFAEGETPDGLIEPVVAYLEANPAELNDPAAALVIRALHAAYPC